MISFVRHLPVLHVSALQILLGWLAKVGRQELQQWIGESPAFHKQPLLGAAPPLDSFAWADCAITGTSLHCRPPILEFRSCRNVAISGLRFANSPWWGLHPVNCSGLSVTDVTLESTEDREGADGIVLDSSRDVRIQRVGITTGERFRKRHKTFVNAVQLRMLPGETDPMSDPAGVPETSKPAPSQACIPLPEEAHHVCCAPRHAGGRCRICTCFPLASRQNGKSLKCVCADCAHRVSVLLAVIASLRCRWASASLCGSSHRSRTHLAGLVRDQLHELQVVAAPSSCRRASASGSANSSCESRMQGADFASESCCLTRRRRLRRAAGRPWQAGPATDAVDAQCVDAGRCM